MDTGQPLTGQVAVITGAGRGIGAAIARQLAKLGATAVLFSLLLPRGLWGTIEERFGLRLLPVGYRVRLPADTAGGGTTPSPQQTTMHQEKA